MSGFTIDRTFQGADITMASIEERTRAALAAGGFGVLTYIDVAATMKKKIGEDMQGYVILGACNPKLAFQAIGVEPKVGTMLPCNVILRAVAADAVEVSAINPQASMTAIDNKELHAVAGQVTELLEKVVAAI